MRLKRLLCGISSALMLISCLSSCGKDTASSINPPVKPEGASEYVQQQWEKWAIGSDIELDWYINSTAITSLKDWDNYTLLKEVKQITGVSPKVRVPSGDLTEKVNTMITMEDWPDLMTLAFGDPIIETLVNEGLVYSMDELCEKYDLDWMNEMLPEMVADHKADDGKLYGIPGGYFAPFLVESKDDIGAYTYSVRKDIYKELGEPSIKTLDDFYNTLKLFKSKYPTMNGKSSIPLHLGVAGTEALGVIQHSFGIEKYYIKNDSSVTINVFHPKYQEFMLFMNKLQREGLLDPESLLKDKSTTDTELATCSFMIPAYFWALDNANSTLTNDQRYISIEPLNATGTDTVKFPSQARMGSMFTVIPKGAKNPEAAVKFLRYMLSKDGNLLMMYGHEGKEYEITSDGKIQRTKEVQDAWTNDYTGYRSRTGMFEFTAAFLKPMPEINMEHPDRQKYDRAIADKYCYDETLLTYYMTPEASSDAGIALTKINDAITRAQYKIITAADEQTAKQELDKLKAKIQESGLESVEKFLTERYQKNLKKFGKPAY